MTVLKKTESELLGLQLGPDYNQRQGERSRIGTIERKGLASCAKMVDICARNNRCQQLSGECKAFEGGNLSVFETLR